MAYKAPLAHDLRLHGSEGFHPVRPSRPSLGDLQYLLLPAKHDRSSFLVCVGVIDSEPRLVGAAWGSLRAETEARPQHTIFNFLLNHVLLFHSNVQSYQLVIIRWIHTLHDSYKWKQMLYYSNQKTISYFLSWNLQQDELYFEVEVWSSSSCFSLHSSRWNEGDPRHTHDKNIWP
jgi:hypothetical protein